MPQQINLCTAVSAPPRQNFPASTLFVYLAASLLLLAGVGSFWLWSLERSAQAYRQTLDSQLNEIQNLQAAIQRSRAAAGPVEPALLREVQEQRALVQQREKMLQLVREGMYQPGAGHSDRLQLLARSVPADTWVTAVKVDSAAFSVSGFTLDTASLNEWVARLGQNPLMRGLSLDTVAVNLVSDAQAAPAKSAVPAWSFNLISVAPVAAIVPVLPAANGTPATGGKP